MATFFDFKTVKKIIFLVCLMVLPVSAVADQVRYIPHSEGALASFLDLIQNSRKSISLTTFIFEPCHASAQVVMDALVAKARSGVQVRILLDRFMHDKTQAQQLNDYFSSHGIQIRWFNTSRLLNLNFRSHIKLIVADGQKYITGGRNIADEYFGLYNGANFIDRDAYVDGASGKEAQKVFDKMWNSSWTKSIKTKNSKISWSEVCENDESSFVATLKAHYALNTHRLVKAWPLRSCPDTHFIADEPGAKILDQHRDGIAMADSKGKHVTSEFLKFIKGTKKSLVMENWSLMPHENMSYEFFDLRWKKIPVLVITNDNMDGPGILKYAEDSFNNRAARRQNQGSLAVKQISMHGDLDDNWTLSPPETEYRLHGKVGVRDDKDVLVSSFNIDQRSYALNMESMILVRNCPALAADLNAGFNELLHVYKKDKVAGVPPNTRDNLLWTLLGALGASFF